MSKFWLILGVIYEILKLLPKIIATTGGWIKGAIDAYRKWKYLKNKKEIEDAQTPEEITDLVD